MVWHCLYGCVWFWQEEEVQTFLLYLCCISCKSLYASFMLCSLQSHFSTHSATTAWMWHNQNCSCCTQHSSPVLGTEVAALIFLSHLFPWEGKDTEDRMGPEVSQMPHFCSMSLSNVTYLGFFWRFKPSPAPAALVQVCLGSPSDKTCLGIKFRGHEWFQDSIFRLCFVSYQDSSII